MADIVDHHTAAAALCMMSRAAKRSIQVLKQEDIKYMKKIEELANKRLGFFRKLELRQEHAKQTINNVSDVVDVKPSKRPRPTYLSTTFDHSKDSTNKNKKKKKVPVKKHVRAAVVRNETTSRMEEFIMDVMKGKDMRLVIQKVLYKSDTRRSQNRLSMPINQLETDEFLTAEEKMIVDKTPEEGNEIEVGLLGPTLEVYKDKMMLTKWRMQSTMNYVLRTKWYEFREENKEHLKKKSTVQVWSFRGEDGRLWFAVAGVEIPDGEESEDDN